MLVHKAKTQANVGEYELYASGEGGTMMKNVESMRMVLLI